MKENPKSARDERESLKCARYKRNNSMKDNPKSARDTNMTIE